MQDVVVDVWIVKGISVPKIVVVFTNVGQISYYERCGGA